MGDDMPNHVDTRLTISGDQTQIDELVDRFGATEFPDFTEIIPPCMYQSPANVPIDGKRFLVTV